MAGAEGRYLGAAVQRGLPKGAAAQDADGDVVQLLLFRRAAGSRPWASAGPRARVPATPGLASKVRVDGVAVSLVLAQHRHGGGRNSAAPGCVSTAGSTGRVASHSPQTPASGVGVPAAQGTSMVAPAP